MRTELPAERLHRRLGADTDADSDTGDDDQPDTSLSRWLPDTKSGDTAAGSLPSGPTPDGRALSRWG